MQLNEDIAHEKKKWKYEKIGRITMLVVIVASISGLLGPGLLSDQTISSGNIAIEYKYFEHNQSPGFYKFIILRSQNEQNPIVISFNNDIVNKINFSTIMPLPKQTLISENKINYIFDSETDVKKTEIIFHYEGNYIGFNPVQIEVNKKTQLKFNQFIYP